MSMTHKYIPRIAQREENLFLEEYYSGTDTKVFLNNNEQSEISYISFSLNEQLKPIYGYASRTFDDMSVGNRIVTGVFKMPIKNPEEQDSYETVVKSSSTIDEINNKNNEEENKKNNTEWINNNDNNSNTNYTNDNVFEYQNKLKQLGYNTSDSGTYDDQTRTAIKKFQKDNNLFTLGTLNNDTMATIDSKIEMQDTPKRTVEQKTNVYTGLTTASGVVYTLQPGEEFYLIQDLGDFYQIRTIDGKDGYIESSKVVEV